MMLIRNSVSFRCQNAVVAAEVIVYSAFLLLLHPVHGRRTFVDFAHTVQATSVEEDTLRRGRLPGINVGHDADISEPGYWRDSGHLSFFTALYMR